MNTPLTKHTGRLRSRIAAAALAAAVVVPSFFSSCNDGSGIGSELVGDEVSIVVDSSFAVSARSVRTDAVLSRTILQLLGVIEAPGYGHISSDFVTQFMPSNTLDTVGVTVNDIDSLKLVMLVNKGQFTGDSLAIMGVEVFPLTRQLSAPIFSDFNPEGYYDPKGAIGSAVYNLAMNSMADSLQKYTYHTISVDLPLEMGRRFYSEYLANPSTFASPSAFAQYFPGLYIRNSYGSGRIARVGNTTMRLYYRQNTKNDAGHDTTYYKIGTYFAVTPEIVTNNDISLEMSDEITSAVSQGEAVMLAPAGLDIEIGFPAREIIASYNKGTQHGIGVVNRLSFQIPVENIANKYDIAAPEDVVLVLKKDREKFFLDNKLPDNITSFRTTLTTTANGSQWYVFADMRQYIVDLMKKGSVSDDDLTFVLVPVSVTTETNSDYYGGATTTVTAVSPYVAEPRMCRILPEKSKINFVYSLQTTNF